VLQTRKDEAEAEMGEAKEGVDSLQQSVNEVQQVVTERRGCLEAMEKEVEGRKVGILVKKMKDLRRSKRTLDKLQGSRIQTSALILLQAELEAAVAETEMLKTRFGIEIPESHASDDEEVEAALAPSPLPQSSQEDKEVEVDDTALAKTDEISEEDEPVSKASEEAPGPEAIAKAKEMHLQIISLEEQLAVAVEDEDFDAADQLNTSIEDLKRQIAELNVDLVSMILYDDEDDEEEDN